MFQLQKVGVFGAKLLLDSHKCFLEDSNELVTAKWHANRRQRCEMLNQQQRWCSFMKLREHSSLGWVGNGAGARLLRQLTADARARARGDRPGRAGIRRQLYPSRHHRGVCSSLQYFSGSVGSLSHCRILFFRPCLLNFQLPDRPKDRTFQRQKSMVVGTEFLFNSFEGSSQDGN